MPRVKTNSAPPPANGNRFRGQGACARSVLCVSHGRRRKERARSTARIYAHWKESHARIQSTSTQRRACQHISPGNAKKRAELAPRRMGRAVQHKREGARISASVVYTRATCEDRLHCRGGNGDARRCRRQACNRTPSRILHAPLASSNTNRGHVILFYFLQCPRPPTKR